MKISSLLSLISKVFKISKSVKKQISERIYEKSKWCSIQKKKIKKHFLTGQF